MQVVGYVRVSTDEQAKDGNSIEEQKERITDECKRKGWGQPIFYVDDGYSGKDMKRPQIRRLLEDLKKGMYAIVITTKLDRLSRKLYETLKFLETLQLHGTRYYCCNMDLDFSTPQGMLMLQQMGSYAEFEREMIRERVRDNMLSIARKSTATKKAFTTPCYGYDVVDGKYVINQEEAKHVLIMVEMAMRGEGSRSIAKHINELGAKSKFNRSWSETTIRQLLSRETLYGQLVYNRSYKKNGRTLVRPKEEWIVIDNHHEPIISEEIYNELQSIMERRKVASKQADNSRYLLSGLLYCGHCDSKMKGIFINKTKYPDRKTFKYLCSNYHKSGGCFYHAVFRDDLEAYIIEEIKYVAEHLESGKNQLVKAPKKEEVSHQHDFELQLKKLDQKMQKQIEAYEEDLISAADLKKARERIDQQRAAVMEMMQGAQQAAAADSDDEVTSNAKKHLKSVLSEDRLESKVGIRQVIHKITITNGEKVKISWNT